MKKEQALNMFKLLSEERWKLNYKVSQMKGSDWKTISIRFLVMFMGEVCSYLITEYGLDEKYYGKNNDKILNHE